MSVDEYIDFLNEIIDDLTKYLKGRKEHLPGNSDSSWEFADNFTFDVHDEIQPFHSSKQHCILHTIVVYYKENR